MRVAVIILCVLVVVFLPTGGGDEPPKPPEPVNPDTPTELVQQIKAALEGQPDDMAIRYAGWFLAVGDTLEGDRPIRELRSAWIEARKTFELPEVLGKVVKRQMESFEEGEIDREKYAEAWDELAAACVEAAK